MTRWLSGLWGAWSQSHPEPPRGWSKKENKEIDTQRIDTKDNLADVFTKK
jgi:hypothetical protein